MKNKNTMGFKLSLLSIACLSMMTSAQENTLDDTEETEKITVTGSRINTPISTSQVVTITTEDMDMKGLATAGDIIRSLPQNFSSVNAGSTTAFMGQDTPSQAMGTSSADLRGLGAGATLVLVNGRRVAGSAVFDSGQVNIDTIPAAAIERVEVILDGASAIYGSDAVAGVINFILKKDYSGSNTKIRYENSATDADSISISQTLGHNWDTGNALLAFEYRSMDGVNAAKAGYTTQDLTSQGGRDHRDYYASRPHLPANIIGLGALPAGHDGVNWDINDLIPTSELAPYDAATSSANTSSSSENIAMTLAFSQELTDDLIMFVDSIYSKNESKSNGGDFVSYFTAVPDTNPYNQLGAPVYVSMLAEGLSVESINNVERINVSGGIDYDLPYEDWSLNLTGNYGKEESEFSRTNISYEDLTTFAATGNVFGNNVAADLAPLVGKQSSPFNAPVRTNQSVEFSADGSLFEISGGEVAMAIGSQVREESAELDPIFIGVVGRLATDQKLKNQAYFVELNVPLVGESNAMPGVRSLVMNIAGRQENYDMTGPFDGLEQPETTKEFDAFTPKVGISWQLNEDLTIRGSYGESFKVPSLDDLNSGLEYLGNYPFRYDYVDGNGNTQVVKAARGGNPDLQPETSTSMTAGLVWSPQNIKGLNVSATYTKIDWEDRIDFVNGGDPRLSGQNPEDYDLILFDVGLEDGGDGDPTTPDYWPGRPVNLANRTLEVIDFRMSYSFETDLGSFITDFNAAYTQSATEQVFDHIDEKELQGTEFGPDDLVFKAMLGWNKDTYGANFLMHYSSSYEHTDPLTPQEKVDSYMTFDVTGFYDFGDGMKIHGGIKNLTDAAFPFYDNQSANYDARRVDARGRVIYLEFSKEFSF